MKKVRVRLITRTKHIVLEHFKIVQFRNACFLLGLDPAKLLYESKSADERIAAGDAKFVDVIHTSSDTIGLHAAVGDIDFYPNGGKSQPRCVLDTSTMN